MEDVCFDDLVNDSLSSNDTVVLILLSHDYTKIGVLRWLLGGLKTIWKEPALFIRKYLLYARTLTSEETDGYY